MNIFDAFNETRTTNGDKAYKRYIGNPYVDFLFRLQKIREIAKYKGLAEVEKLITVDYPEFLEQSEFNRLSSRFRTFRSMMSSKLVVLMISSSLIVQRKLWGTSRKLWTTIPLRTIISF